MVGILVKE
jgi:carbonic anhydrase/acetyltransferase-like protein (isoleucine patch superfamily)